MYIKNIEIENVGPIRNLNIEFPTQEDRPKPVLIVGENGTGKSILLSHLVNSLIVGKQSVFDNVEVEKGKVYKFRSPHYIQSGSDYSFSSVKFQSGIEVQELQLNRTKSDFETSLGYVPARKLWHKMPTNETSMFLSTFDSHSDAAADLFKRQCCLYFPVDRYEEPGWLNLENLKERARYSNLKHISGHSNRDFICTSPLKTNKDWLLDVIFDRQAFEIQSPLVSLVPHPEQPPVQLPIFTGYSGQSTTIYEAALRIVKVILRTGESNVRLGAGTRKNRQIAVMRNGRSWVPNLFQLSTGEVLLLNLFLSIVRDYDLSEGSFTNLDDIKGIVVIDEIDAHLHASHQKEVLPELIASFPNVQFIITTHSPLFLMGMQQKLGSENFIIYNMPDGDQLAVSDFSEFNAAYDSFKETARHRKEILDELERHSQPIVFVEGDYDIRYINKAAELLDKQEVVAKIQIKDGGGFGNLDKVWRGYDNALSEILPHKIILLYDCDTKKSEANKGRVYKRVIPSFNTHSIAVGIENLFSVETIQRVEAQNPQFIDTEEPTQKRVRGEVINTPGSKLINKDEKGNLCNWLCENGTAQDFAHFKSVFQVIEEIVGP